MGNTCGNKPVEIIPGVPKDVEKLRKELITRIGGGMKEGATRYQGQLSTGTNPMQTNAASLISNLMGQGNYSPMQGTQMPGPQWGGGSGGETNYNSNNDPRFGRQPRETIPNPIPRPGVSDSALGGMAPSMPGREAISGPGMRQQMPPDPRIMMMMEMAKRKRTFGV